ncbi:uncharacterized protein BYT42DRAFT_531297 [Radiomyces spectabilis]|uniref:uncharacterized protein n=1 Tax=Radiomyces spectabilis TaxID=64574 RepID=UPI002220FC6E|nr:uncharacterized protein BYT42DRAFT_531297 [Radiomyces spectabilis]KAI8381434.1 hypothetical protein BYT42DRAFT_531297 [Radiomyces spectabilis]
MANKGTQKTLEKLKASVNAGNYYEAHQMYRTVARRYNKQQKYDHTIQLLHDGALSLMQHGQSTSGADLANYMLETYKIANVPVDAASLDRVVELLSLYSPKEAGRKTYISSAFSWTQKNGEYREGDPELHDFVGTMFYQEGRFQQAEEHLLVGTDHSAEVLGELASAWTKEEEGPLEGFHIARIVLQLLAMKNIHHATLALASYVKAAQPKTTESLPFRCAPADEPVQLPVYDDSWTNFAQLMLLTCQRDSADFFRQLRTKYNELYGPHKGFDELLDDIGAVFFNIPKPRKQGNMLQDLMSSLFSGPPAPAPQQRRVASGMELD